MFADVSYCMSSTYNAKSNADNPEPCLCSNIILVLPISRKTLELCTLTVLCLNLSHINAKYLSVKTHYKGDSHSSNTASIILPGLMIKQR